MAQPHPTADPEGPLDVVVTPDPAGGRVRVDWSLPPGSEPEEPAYRVWLRVEGHRAAWHRDEPWRTTHLQLPWSMVAQSVPVHLELVVQPLDASGRGGPLHASSFVVPPLVSVPRSDRWRVGPTEVVVDDGARRDAGLEWWPDGTVGFAEVDGVAWAFAADGPRAVRWPLGPDRFLGTAPRPVRIEGLPDDLDYAAGGPVFTAPDGLLVLFVHEEVHPGGEAMDFWSAIGLAASLDGGATFTYLGRVVAPQIDAGAPQRRLLTEVGGAPFAVVGEHLHLYFRETAADGRARNLGVARAPVAEVVPAARAGRASPWTKLGEHGWDEPGLGGLARELLPAGPPPRWFDVVHLTRHDRYLLVCSDGMVDHWSYVVVESPDGVAWGAPAHLAEPSVGPELLYLSVVGPDPARPWEADGDEVHLYRTRTEHAGARRWDEARLERLVLTYRPPPGPGGEGEPSEDDDEPSGGGTSAAP